MTFPLRRPALAAAALALALALAARPAAAERTIVTRTVEYRQGDTALEGYLAAPADGGKHAAVLVVHDWLGVGPYVKGRADQLARLGYVAFAPDIYGKGVRPAGPQEAGAIAGKLKGDRPLLRARAEAGLAELRRLPNVDGARVAAIGYCFGGTTVLELARAGADLAGVVSFHGGLDSPTPSDAKNIRAKVLVLHGAEDPYVPDAQVKGFEDEMRAGKVDWQLVKYAGAVHAFSQPQAGNDPSKGAAYDARADRRSWQAMRAFFDEVLR